MKKKYTIEGLHFVKLARVRYDLTQTELAEKAGVSRTTISKIESNNSGNITLDTLTKIFNALGYIVKIQISHKQK